MTMMKFIACFPAITVMLIFLQNHLVASLTPIHQKTALFHFKQSLTIGAPTTCYYYDCYSDSYEIPYSDSYEIPYYDLYEIPSYPKTKNWSMSSDHCTWEGVTCQHETGHVIGLDLSCSQLEGAILPNSPLFQLSHLRFLNLSQNNFSLSNQFPQEFGSFAKGLTHLNLCNTQFSGRVPSGISHLYKLVSLDLSYNYYAVELENEVFKSLLQNLTQLRVLNLVEVGISSVLPVNLSTSLRVLNLRNAGILGRVPSGIAHLYKLVSLDLSDDYGAAAVKLEDEVFKSVVQNLTQLRVLHLYEVNISSVLPENLSTSLRVLDLSVTGLHGALPQEVFHLPNIEVLALGSTPYDEQTPFEHRVSSLGLEAVLPKVKWGSSATLQQLSLRGINFHQGPIPDSIGFLESLVSLDLWSCNLSGPIPRSIGNLGRLTSLYLGHNNLNGPIPTVLTNLTNLTYLELPYNNFTGPFLSSVAHFKGLTRLYLGNNRFTGLLPTGLFNHPSLEVLSLSYNGFTGQLYEFNSSKSQLYRFDCRSNLLYGHIPQSLFQLVTLTYLDISNNEIEGEIPHASMGRWWYLNISHNRLTGGIEQLPWNIIAYLDLQSNKLNGSLPTLICNSTYLHILNLSNNNLSGVLPICQTNLTFLSVLDLRMNKIQGNIPATLSNFRYLETINLNGNRLEGRIPSSFAEFYSLKVLDLGNNEMNDTFPECLEALPYLQVLVLKSNKFHGLINKSSKIEHPFPSLRIIDLSYNEFSGPLPAMYFQNFKAMMFGDVNEREATYIGYDLGKFTSYSDSTVLVIKGVEIQFVRILTVLTTIDLSRNNFEGEIPEYIGKLILLRYLNLSHNHLTGHIPSSIGNLSMLESLDLSSNQLEGEIPRQLTSINTLARLNLSCNQLDGQIPKGSQFNTFDNDSYVGNIGLCGFPLSKECEHDIEIQKEGEDDDYFFSGFTWEAVVIGYGCGVVPAFIIGNLMLLAGKPKWFVGIIARELGLKIRRMEIRMR